jgi:hypothetical protein
MNVAAAWRSRPVRQARTLLALTGVQVLLLSLLAAP